MSYVQRYVQHDLATATSCEKHSKHQELLCGALEHLSIGALAARLRHTSSTTPKQTSENESCFMRTVSYRPVTKSFTSIPIHWDRVAKSMPCTGTLRFAGVRNAQNPSSYWESTPFQRSLQEHHYPKGNAT